VPDARTDQRIPQLAAEAVGASSPGEALRKMTELRRELEAFERLQVAQALAEGANFAAIARDLGVSRQAAHRRFRSLADSRPPLLSTPDTRRVLSYAREEATALGSDVPRGEHVLLAVLRAADLPASAVLRNAGVTLVRARLHVADLEARHSRFQRQSRESELRDLLAAPVREARRRHSRRIEVEHLLLGALDGEPSGAAATLTAFSIEPDTIRDALAALLESRSP
jgi:ATP-dependent Clp protease ATP-binding subunit ClpA